MTKIIKQIGMEGRTTIPYLSRKAMRLEDGDFISFTYDKENKTVTIQQEWICDGCDCEESEIFSELLLIFLGLNKEEQEKAAFILKKMLFGELEKGGIGK